jgi:hypothetical protein
MLQSVFHRSASSLEEATRSAIGDVQQAGFQVAPVLIQPESLATTG